MRSLVRIGEILRERGFIGRFDELSADCIEDAIWITVHYSHIRAAALKNDLLHTDVFRARDFLVQHSK
jgi:hypothetical protein